MGEGRQREVLRRIRQRAGDDGFQISSLGMSKRGVRGPEGEELTREKFGVTDW